jgi:hypothetical protein
MIERTKFILKGRDVLLLLRCHIALSKINTWGVVEITHTLPQVLHSSTAIHICINLSFCGQLS